MQFAANACPAASIYGKARAITPLLDKPLEGPVYLRSSSHELPDLVADLNGQLHVVLVGRIDSVKGGIRNTFEAVPDAPVSKFVLEMQGGKKGLLQNSTNICKSPEPATVKFTGQNGKSQETSPLLKVRCPKHPKKHKRNHPPPAPPPRREGREEGGFLFGRTQGRHVGGGSSYRLGLLAFLALAMTRGRRPPWPPRRAHPRSAPPG